MYEYAWWLILYFLAALFKDIDPREVTARMDTEIVNIVLGMGFEKDFIRQVIEYRLRTNGLFPSYIITIHDFNNVCI